MIRPISDLRNKSTELSLFAHESGEPIFITKNGEGDLVLMSLVSYAKLQLKIDLMGKLAVAQAEEAQGGKGRLLKDVMTDLRSCIL
ncbi:MAG: type II toxin-antitoxin system prevent-host-death family antitoxin [Myxococcaceae bacterium]